MPSSNTSHVGAVAAGDGIGTDVIPIKVALLNSLLYYDGVLSNVAFLQSWPHA